MKQSQKVKVKNPLGLHARPATVMKNFCAQALAAGKNGQIMIDVEGEEDVLTLAALVHAFETEFGEEEIEFETGQ